MLYSVTLSNVVSNVVSVTLSNVVSNVVQFSNVVPCKLLVMKTSTNI